MLTFLHWATGQANAGNIVTPLASQSHTTTPIKAPPLGTSRLFACVLPTTGIFLFGFLVGDFCGLCF